MRNNAQPFVLTVVSPLINFLAKALTPVDVETRFSTCVLFETLTPKLKFRQLICILLAIHAALHSVREIVSNAILKMWNINVTLKQTEWDISFHIRAFSYHFNSELMYSLEQSLMMFKEIVYSLLLLHSLRDENNFMKVDNSLWHHLDVIEILGELYCLHTLALSSLCLGFHIYEMFELEPRLVYHPVGYVYVSCLYIVTKRWLDSRDLRDLSTNT